MKFLTILAVLLMCVNCYASGDATQKTPTELCTQIYGDDTTSAINTDSGGNLQIDIEAGTAILTGQTKIIVPAGSALPLSLDSTSTFRSITISPLLANTCDVVIGPAGQQSLATTCYRITNSSDVLVLNINKLTAISIDSVDGGSGVSWIGIVE